MADDTAKLLKDLSTRVTDLELLTGECKHALGIQRDSLDTLTKTVESSATMFSATLKLVEKNGTDAYKEVISELREDMRTRMRWVLMAVSIGAAIAGGSNLLPTLELLP